MDLARPTPSAFEIIICEKLFSQRLNLNLHITVIQNTMQLHMYSSHSRHCDIVSQFQRHMLYEVQKKDQTQKFQIKNVY